ncbi:hypothetical protein GCM10022226_33820 [Sphaerisporangium flaviroseum]|uniref:HTH luxR-type domain-containing protein n=1 Tax=Sphaerisporangium flaviroseum TaxID=509199 RepID=A0ABP7I669_9ACTN
MDETGHVFHPPDAGGKSVNVLTGLELTVLSLIGCGYSVPEIAKRLKIRPRAVESHKRHLYQKLGVGTQSHAVARAIALGLFDLPRNAGWVARLRPEAGRPELVVVHAAPGTCLQHVVIALLGCGTSFVLTRTRELGGDHWMRWHRGTLTVLLMDPTAHDWTLPARLGAPVIIVRSTPPALTAVMDALRRGARALLWGDELRRDLGTVLPLVAGRYFVMSSAYVGKLPFDPSESGVGDLSWTVKLTPRERDILGSIACGHTIRQTARTLGIASKTVENTQARLFRKLGAKNRSETLTIAYQLGVVQGIVD